MELQEENNRLNVLISELIENIRLVTEKVKIIECDKLNLQRIHRRRTRHIKYALK